MPPRPATTFLFPPLIALVALVVVPGCCFGGSETLLTLDESLLPGEHARRASEPGYDVLSICAVEALYTPAGSSGPRCIAHAPGLPASTDFVQASFRTSDLVRFGRGGAVVGGIGEGAGFSELVRRALPSAPPPSDGERATWGVRAGIAAPASGWPSGVPVRFRLLDADGAIVSEAITWFHGSPQSPG